MGFKLLNGYIIVTEEFVEVVKNWVKLDDEIRDYNDKVKELKNESNSL